MALYIEQVAERDEYVCDVCNLEIPKDTVVDNLDLGFETLGNYDIKHKSCLLYTSPSPRDA